METNYKKIKSLISKLEKKQRELNVAKTKVTKISKDIEGLEKELTSLLNNSQNNKPSPVSISSFS